MAEISQNTKYVKLDNGVSFELVRTNPKLTTNTKLMYNGKNIYMESYASSSLLNRMTYKNVPIKSNSLYNKDIAKFLLGSGSQAYSVYQNFSDVVVSDSYDNQFETLYWCGAEYIDSSFYTEEIGFIAPLYLREKLPNYFLIFRIYTPSNYNFNVDDKGNRLDSSFDFKTDILDKVVLIKTFDLREGSPLGNYIHNYVEQDDFEFDKSIYVNFSNSEVTYYGINKINGIFEKKIESFQNELLNNDKPLLKDDEWFSNGFERNNLIFPYIMNIEYLFNDENFNHDENESYEFARYIGLYCNNIEFGEFTDFSELIESVYTQEDVIYYFEDNKKKLHRYVNKESGFKIDGNDSSEFDVNLISGFEKERITGYAEPLDKYEGFINRAQYGFEISKPLEPGDWVGMVCDGHFEYYFADNTIDDSDTFDNYKSYRFYVGENSTLNDIADSLVKTINRNKKSNFEARCSDNIVAFYTKREGEEYNGSQTGGAKILIEASLLYNKKISLPISKYTKHVNELENNIDNNFDFDINDIKLLFGDYYIDYFCGACNVEIDESTETYKNVFKIYTDEYVFFNLDRYLKTNNGDGRRIITNMLYINGEGKIDNEYRIVIVEDIPEDKIDDNGYDISVSSTYQVEIMDKFKPNHGVLSWFPVKDFDFDINYSTYGLYDAFVDECNILSKKITYKQLNHIVDTYADSDYRTTYEDSTYGIKELAKSPFFDDYGNSLETEYDYYLEQFHPDMCLISKTVPYILKWGYYDEQKDSCENPYRLNINKVFGVSNLSANTYLRNCDENEYTHNMPYYMTFGSIDYYKDYQYIVSDDVYRNMNDINNTHEMSEEEPPTFFDCVDYWIRIFKKTDEDMFSYFFSGKKYGKRFDRKYSRMLGGDKFHNPSTLFRGVKFEIVRQYNGVEKRSSEYNDYKFSFVYIPVMLDSMIFNSTVHFVKNDTFKFIVGIIFVNTMLGTYNHNIFNGNIDYFNKGFLYAACKDIIRPENTKKYSFNLNLTYGDETKQIENVNNDVWENNYDIGKNKNEFYMWRSVEDDGIIITKTKDMSIFINDVNKINEDIIGEFINIDNIENVNRSKIKYTFESIIDDNNFKVITSQYYENFDITIYRNKTFEYYGSITCEISAPNIDFNDNIFVDICDIEWKYYDEEFKTGYKVDISEIHFKSESLRNILVNMNVNDSVSYIIFYDINNEVYKRFENNEINVDLESGVITIKSEDESIILQSLNGVVEDLRITISIKDIFDTNLESLGLKDYFNIFEQISMYNITESINSDYNVKYYSTVEDNKYKIRVIEPDSIEIKDMYEAIPVKITQNNKSVVGSIDIKKKMDVDKIGIKTINRYSGFYNPIFNDILYYGDYIYTKNIGRLRNEEKFELPYSNTNIDYNYSDGYGIFGIIKNMYYHKTNISRSNNILTFDKPVYPIINEYAIDYRDYNIFSSSWDEGYFITQDDLDNRTVCDGIGSMKNGLCMFGSKYLNLPDHIFLDTFENGKIWDDKMVIDVRDNTDTEIMYKEINNRTVRYQLFIEKRLKRYLKESLIGVFSKYINKEYSFGNKGTIEDDVEEYVEKNLLKLYKVDKVFMYIKEERMRINDKNIENEYLKYVGESNEIKIENGFPVESVGDGVVMKNGKFSIGKINEFDRMITYNLKNGFKESFGFGISFKRK